MTGVQTCALPILQIFCKIVKFTIIRAFQFQYLVGVKNLENFVQGNKDSSVFFYGRYHYNMIRPHFTVFLCNTNDFNRGIEEEIHSRVL